MAASVAKRARWRYPYDDRIGPRNNPYYKPTCCLRTFRNAYRGGCVDSRLTGVMLGIEYQPGCRAGLQ
jgi:hypothetical protein